MKTSNLITNPRTPIKTATGHLCLNPVGISQMGLFVLAMIYFVTHAKPVLLPLMMSLLLTMVLKPVHRVLRDLRLPGPLAAAIVVFCVLCSLYLAANRLAEPASAWLDTIDMESAEARIAEIFAPVQAVQQDLKDVAKKVDRMTGPAAPTTERDAADPDARDSATPTNEAVVTVIPIAKPAAQVRTNEPPEATKPESDSEPVPVEISDRPANIVIDYIQSFGVNAAATLLVIFFFLGFGETMHRRLSEDEGTADLIKNVGRDVSAYLFTISTINCGLGACIAIAVWLFDLPNPILWGVMAALLNFIPYLGAIVGSVIVFFVAIVSLDEPALAFMVPFVYFILTSIEGNVVTPMIIGRRFTLNPIVVAVWFLSWGALWGVPGMLLATPTLMAFKIVCVNVAMLARVDRIISV